MANTEVTKVSITAAGTNVELALTAATKEATGAEVFEIVPTKSDEKGVIVINNAATDQGTITYSLAAGDSAMSAGAALTGSVAQGKLVVLQVESGKYISGGKYLLTLTPATGKILKTNHTASVGYLETYL
jgi:hypothetical protein